MTKAKKAKAVPSSTTLAHRMALASLKTLTSTPEIRALIAEAEKHLKK